MTRRFILVTCAAMASDLFAETAATIAPADSAALVLTVEKTGLMAGKQHRFVFADYRGQALGEKEVTFTVRSASIRCEDTWVNEKDKAKILKYALKDMLDADHYPEIRYVSSAVRANGSDGYAIDGNLTIRDKTRPVFVNATREFDRAGRPWWNGSAAISLNDFGLKAPTAALGTIGTKDKMQLTFHLKAA